MIVKENIQKIGKVMLMLLLAILVIFIIATSNTALSTQKEINVDNYIGKTFISRDLDTKITFASNDEIRIVYNNLISFQEIIEKEHDVLLIHDIEGDFAIKFIDEYTLYCEKSRDYLYLYKKE